MYALTCKGWEPVPLLSWMFLRIFFSFLTLQARRFGEQPGVQTLAEARAAWRAGPGRYAPTPTDRSCRYYIWTKFEGETRARWVDVTAVVWSA